MAYTAIIGASGYSGQETIDRVLAHPELDLFALGSDSLAGQPASSLDPRLALNGSRRAPAFVTNDEALASGADLTFICLDHERAAAIEPPARGVVVDLSGAHRLKDAALYEDWYGFSHPRAEELTSWSYSIPELFPPSGRLVANPGCFAVAALLALKPLAEILDPDSVVIDGKTGISGAGKSLKPSSHASTVLENVSAYRVGRHQHEPEMAQALGFPVCFAPHLLPIRRGLITTCYAKADAAEARSLLEAAYLTCPAVSVLAEGITPELARVQGTDAAEIAVFEDRATGKTIVISAIDNLGKGAAGQAVQNANLALGYRESAGLRLSGVLV